MASIERTAYPQFKRNPVVRELVAAYTPTDAELAFVAESTRQPAHRLTLAILIIPIVIFHRAQAKEMEGKLT